MDTKWKNNKKRSVFIASAMVLVLTIIFLSFFPFFEEQADKEFEDPFTGVSFVRMLYESNYIQYKYLRERADQRTYSFTDLYVDAQYLGEEQELQNFSGSVYQVSGDAVAQSAVLDENVQYAMENSVSELWNFKSQSMELTQMMDYYAVDKESGLSIGNSSQTALKEIAGGASPENNPYVYYVYLNYGSIGNLENCAVSAVGSAGEFLKRVESLGRENYLEDSYDESGTSHVVFYNSDEDLYYRYKLTLKRPADMKIVYAMTWEQYQAFLQGYDQYTFLPNYVYSSQNSYFSSGVTGTLLLFAAIAMALGAASVHFFNRKEKGSYIYQELRICRLPLEVNAIIFLCGIAFAQPLVCQICAYQKGWFLPNLTDQILEPMDLTWCLLPVVAVLFYLYFFIAFTLGSTLPRLLHFKRCFKEYSLVYRYWDRIVTYLKNFYQELVNFDIGTDANRIILKLVAVNFVILSFVSMLWFWGIFALAVYSVIIYFLLKKYVKDIQNKYQNLLKATSAIARGDFDIALSEDFGVFESYKNELRQIQVDFKKTVDEEVKSQRMKSELITNVSHDLKTPLTAIITYINLLKEPGVTEEQRQEYINTLDKKAVRLKLLIEDLFEVSKATTNNVTLNYERVDIGNLMRQCYLEYEDRIEEANLQFKFMLPEEKVILTLDPQKTFRIFENLYTNIIKYALPATRVYVVLKDREEETEIEIKNISRTELLVSPEELTERFVRGDDSRNTEGSGLGLAIVRSFAELQHGVLHISVDGDLFKATLIFRKWNGIKETEPEALHAGGAASAPVKAERAAIDPQTPPAPSYDPRRWRTEKNLRKKRWNRQ
ncbi:MAG: HAMP domain-containing sensor histidine kinase [Eubacteriales bacterium]|nr:HAMP domain-containing sensor histidine kinase [Eubacteriales bacterium]